MICTCLCTVGLALGTYSSTLLKMLDELPAKTFGSLWKIGSLQPLITDISRMSHLVCPLFVCIFNSRGVALYTPFHTARYTICMYVDRRRLRCGPTGTSLITYFSSTLTSTHRARRGDRHKTPADTTKHHVLIRSKSRDSSLVQGSPLPRGL